MDILHHGDESVSVAFAEIRAKDGKEKVYTLDILNHPKHLFKKPGYTM